MPTSTVRVLIALACLLLLADDAWAESGALGMRQGGHDRHDRADRDLRDRRSRDHQQQPFETFPNRGRGHYDHRFYDDRGYGRHGSRDRYRDRFGNDRRHGYHGGYGRHGQDAYGYGRSRDRYDQFGRHPGHQRYYNPRGYGRGDYTPGIRRNYPGTPDGMRRYR